MPKRPAIDAIEFLKGRVYLGAYSYHPTDTDELVYFTVEDELPYNAFHLDFGPLHIGHLYRFAVVLHSILNDPSNKNKAVVFYSSTGAKERTNAACILCCYMVLVQNWSPHQVLHPIAQHDPPFMPYRDAGYSHADFELSIQDIVYGMWRAKERQMIDITSFNLEEYEQYERVDQGDFNVISKDFIAFASPKQSRPGSNLNEPFKKVLEYFVSNDVQLVVRLNSHLYDKNEFEKRGIKHIDMIFDDGTCPTMEYVQKFVGAAETVISNGGKIAVHCKAGLGRTGCLIGAHLIYTHGFTANECIAYMRMIRPGMVVGPQQHWLYLHQNEFRDWRHTMVVDTIPDEFIGGLYPLVAYEDYKKRSRALRLKALSTNNNMSSNNNNNDIEDDENLIDDEENDLLKSPLTPIRRRKISGQLKSAHRAVPMESPGQPRKYRQSNNSAIVPKDYKNINSDDEDCNNTCDATYDSTHHNNSQIHQQQQQQQQEKGSISNTANVEEMDVQKDYEYENVEPISASPQRSSIHSSSSSSSSHYNVVKNVNSHSSPLQVTKTRTVTTTTTTTVAPAGSNTTNSPNGSPMGLKISKQRGGSNNISLSSKVRGNRVPSGEKVIGSVGIKKITQTKRISSQF
ncbi:unnamed protein product [[Candida] boidinii]|uniref:Unnamed protein product n=1 Tax=Candida boidinii TaxID=5477 RepID=A0ACB5TFB8_CANBO|nr:unnamed protein product [[Candida] boidinii]